MVMMSVFGGESSVIRVTSGANCQDWFPMRLAMEAHVGAMRSEVDSRVNLRSLGKSEALGTSKVMVLAVFWATVMGAAVVVAYTRLWNGK